MADSTTLPSVGQQVTGTVTRVVLAGVMVDIGTETPALLHISQIGNSDVQEIGDAYSVGDEVSAFVLQVKQDDGYIALAMTKPPTVTWQSLRAGEKFQGEVVRLERFGAFVDIGAERPGMVHVSEMTEGFVENPEDIVAVGQQVDVWVLKVDKRRKQIDLSMKEPLAEVLEEIEEEDVPTAMELAFRRAEETPKAQADKKSKQDEQNKSAIDDILSRTLQSQDN